MKVTNCQRAVLNSEDKAIVIFPIISTHNNTHDKLTITFALIKIM